jgi:hypothetical protein|tara:strand:+ start:1052 stop:1282 length:231 start_codon:yes stop_codon:yes gene_type:complete
MKYHTTRTDDLEKRDKVIETLKDHYDSRSKKGIIKYNTTLHDNNDDDFLVHLLEELMDATAYITKLLMQRKDDNVL